MKCRNLVCLVVLSAWAAAAAHAATQQSVENVLPDGSAYLWVEAESAVELGGGPPEAAVDGFILVDKENPIQTITEDANGLEVINGGADVLPEDTNASGGAAIFHNFGGGNAKWQVQFAIPESYYLYMHYSFYNRDSNTNYGNEDSIYVPPDFNLNSRSDWIGYEGVDATFEEPKIGNSNRDGWMPLGKDIVSAGEVETHNSTDEDFWEGQFHWAWMDVTVDMDENNSFIGDNGHGIRYEISEDEVGTVLDFEISTREPYGVIDGLLFSTSPDLLLDFTQEQMDEFFLNLGGGTGVVGDFNKNGQRDPEDLDLLTAAMASNDPAFDLDGDGDADFDDRKHWVEVLTNTFFGDSNFDGEFNSSDFVQVFGTAKYEKEESATWTEGDWNGDGFFNSSDFVTAFAGAGYEKGPREGGLMVVPEPTGLVLCLLGVLSLCRLRRHAS